MIHENLNQIIEESSDAEVFSISLKDISKQIIHLDKHPKTTKSLRIIHFNDVYNIEPSIREPAGGAARFLSVINLLKNESPCLVMFSGDIFSPSPCRFFEFNLNLL